MESAMCTFWICTQAWLGLKHKRDLLHLHREWKTEAAFGTMLQAMWTRRPARSPSIPNTRLDHAGLCNFGLRLSVCWQMDMESENIIEWVENSEGGTEAAVAFQKRLSGSSPEVWT